MGEASLPLMVWLSPAFPVGAFAYSHGLEQAHEDGALRDAASLEGWLADLLEHGAGRNDAILLAHAYRALAQDDLPRLAEIAELALALCSCVERRLEAVGQGNAFVAAIAQSWPSPRFALLRAAWPGGDVAYPVAVGAAAAAHDLALDETLRAFCLAFVANLVSAAVRLGAVGQTDGQRVTAALVPHVARVAEGAFAAALDELGGCAFASDLASLRHETQYCRLFRS